jgi:hypothetical protein
MPVSAELIRSSDNTVMALSRCAIAVVTGAKMSPHPLRERAPLLQLEQHSR